MRRSTTSSARRVRPRRAITLTRSPVTSLAAGAAVADQLARSRQLYPGRRWSPEQKRLRTQLRGQRRAGRSFDQLRHVGAVVLHARRLPHSAQPVDHLIVTAGAAFAVLDVAGTRREPITWTSDGHLAQAGIDTDTLEASLAGRRRGDRVGDRGDPRSGLAHVGRSRHRGGRAVAAPTGVYAAAASWWERLIACAAGWSRRSRPRWMRSMLR